MFKIFVERDGKELFEITLNSKQFSIKDKFQSCNFNSKIL